MQTTRLNQAFLSFPPPIHASQDITYTVVSNQNKKEKLNLLQNVGGYLLPGEMSALMGCVAAATVQCRLVIELYCFTCG